MSCADRTETRRGAFEEQVCSIIHGSEVAAMAEALGEGDMVVCVALVDSQVVVAQTETSDGEHGAVGDGGLVDVEAAFLVEVILGPEPMFVRGGRPVQGGGVPRVADVVPKN